MIYAQLTYTTELGIVGMIVSGLFSFAWYAIWSSNKREDRRTETHAHTLREIHTIHRTERDEWNNREDRRQADTNKVLQELSAAIRESELNRIQERKVALESKSEVAKQ